MAGGFGGGGVVVCVGWGLVLEFVYFFKQFSQKIIKSASSDFNDLKIIRYDLRSLFKEIYDEHE